MRALVLGAACAGKTTLCRHLRTVCGVNAIDTNDQILRLNDGVWPTIERKNDVLLPMALASVIGMREVVLLNSYMPVHLMVEVRQAGFQTLLLNVSEAELRRRHELRLTEEGWTNAQWLDWNQKHLRELLHDDLFDHVISGEQNVESVAAEILSVEAG